MGFTLACSDSSFTIPGRKGHGKCWFLNRVKKWENPVTRGKPLRGKAATDNNPVTQVWHN